MVMYQSHSSSHPTPLVSLAIKFRVFTPRNCHPLLFSVVTVAKRNQIYSYASSNDLPKEDSSKKIKKVRRPEVGFEPTTTYTQSTYSPTELSGPKQFDLEFFKCHDIERITIFKIYFSSLPLYHLSDTHTASFTSLPHTLKALYSPTELSGPKQFDLEFFKCHDIERITIFKIYFQLTA